MASKNNLAHTASILEGKFVLEIKDEETNSEVWKAWLVVQVYRDKSKTSLVHNSAAIRQYFIRVLIATSTTLKLQVF